MAGLRMSHEGAYRPYFSCASASACPIEFEGGPSHVHCSIRHTRLTGRAN